MKSIIGTGLILALSSTTLAFAKGELKQTGNQVTIQIAKGEPQPGDDRGRGKGEAEPKDDRGRGRGGRA